MAHADREIVENALSPDMVAEIWTGNYEKVLPITLLDFELSAVLPAVFYMFRFGHRRGVGNFLATYGPAAGTPAPEAPADHGGPDRGEARGDPRVGRVRRRRRAGYSRRPAALLLSRECPAPTRPGPAGAARRADPLPSELDRSAPIVWRTIRFVPEMIVAMLANRRTGDYVTPSDEADRTRFAVVNRYEHNLLLRAFDQGVTRRGGLLGDLASDRFNESDDTVGLDQLLTIRLAQQLGTAPKKLRPSPVQGADAHRISNQRPIAKAAARRFSDDIRRFVRSYADSAPRHAFVDMLESCITIGLTTILGSTVEVAVPLGGDGEGDGCRHPAARRPSSWTAPTARTGGSGYGPSSRQTI